MKTQGKSWGGWWDLNRLDLKTTRNLSQQREAIVAKHDQADPLLYAYVHANQGARC